MVERGAAPRRQAEDRGLDRRRRRAPAGRRPGSRSAPPAARRCATCPGAIRCPTLAAWKLTVSAASIAAAGDLAAGGVDPGGDVAGDDRGAAAVGRFDRGAPPARAAPPRTRCRRSRRRPRPSPRARRRGPPAARRRRARAPRPRSRSRRSRRAATRPSPPLLPLPQRTRTGPCGASAGDGVGERRAGGLHQLRLRHPLLVDRPAVDRADALGVIEGAEPRLHQPIIATAAAKSREWVSETPIVPARRRLGGAAAERDPRRLAGDHLDLARPKPPAEPERLDHRLLRGEARGEVAPGPGAVGRVARARPR